MKHLILRNSNSSINVDVQVDIFASNEEVLASGFETRFTNMHINNYTDDAKKLFNLQEIENSFVAMKNLVNGVAGLGLFMTDNSYPKLSKVAQVDNVTLAGTSGTANVTINGNDYLATFTTDLATSADNFVTSHAATILSTEGVVVTHPGADGVLVLTANVAGVAFTSVASNVSGDLAGTISNETINQSGEGEVTIIPTHHPVV